MADRQPTDEELVAAYRESGRPEVLDGLLRRHTGRVRAMMYQMVLDDADADDLTQEVFLRAVRGLSRFEGRSRFSTWLHRIAMNAAHSFLRQRSRSREVAADGLADRPDGRIPTPDKAAIARELDAEVAAAMAELPPTWRAALVLRVFHGLGVREAARVEGCAASTIYWRVHKARGFLRKRLGDYLA